MTDMDTIEKRNLHRQTLFRSTNAGQSKSQVACRAASQRNPSLRNNIKALLVSVAADTRHIFNDNFFRSLSGVTNALDEL